MSQTSWCKLHEMQVAVGDDRNSPSPGCNIPIIGLVSLASMTILLGRLKWTEQSPIDEDVVRKWKFCTCSRVKTITISFYGALQLEQPRQLRRQSTSKRRTVSQRFTCSSLSMALSHLIVAYLFKDHTQRHPVHARW